jgi:hypothetical protein
MHSENQNQSHKKDENETRKKHPGGRPTRYTPELAEKICKVVSISPFGLRKICSIYDWMPDVDTIREWRFDNREFSDQFAKAKIQQADILVEDSLDIADDSSDDYYIDDNGNRKANNELVARSRLRIDTRKFMGMKLLPKIYGDFEEVKEQNEDLKNEIRELRAKLDAQNKKDY